MHFVLWRIYNERSFQYLQLFIKKRFSQFKLDSKSKLKWKDLHIFKSTDLIFVMNITNYIRRDEIVMWKNFSFPCITIVGKFKFSPHVEKFQYNWWGFIAIYAGWWLNLLFTLFCREIFATICALSCGEKLSPKVHLWRKMTNTRSEYNSFSNLTAKKWPEQPLQDVWNNSWNEQKRSPFEAFWALP